jgi:hypothetical protein
MQSAWREGVWSRALCQQITENKRKIVRLLKNKGKNAMRKVNINGKTHFKKSTPDRT